MNLKKSFAGILTSFLILTTASCSNPKSSIEYQALEAEVEALNSQIQTVEETITKRAADSASISSLTTKRAELIENFDAIFSDPSRRQAIISSLGKDACTRFENASQEALSIEDGIGSKLREEINKRINPGDSILGNVNLGGDDMYQSINNYADELAKTRCAYNAQNEFFKQCETVDKKLINKNPESFKGKCIKGTVRIAQFDSNTGPCAFQGYLGGGYDVRAQFGQTLDPNTHDEEKECSWTEKLVEDNFITFWGWGLGAYTYTTSNGGSQTIPAFKMVMYQKG